jgi:hypothetical protein
LLNINIIIYNNQKRIKHLMEIGSARQYYNLITLNLFNKLILNNDDGFIYNIGFLELDVNY